MTTDQFVETAGAPPRRGVPALLDGIDKIFREALDCSREEDLGRLSLKVAEVLTSSRFGFIGMIGKDDRLDDIAISESGWTVCRMEDRKRHETPPGGFLLHGIYGRVLGKGDGFFTNRPADHPDRVGFPDGHPPITCFMGVPLRIDSHAIGMVAVANRPGGYRDTDLWVLRRLAPAIAQVLHAKRIDNELQAEQARLKAVFSAIPHAVVEYDAGMRPIQANQAALALAGCRSLEDFTTAGAGAIAFIDADGHPVPATDSPAAIALGGDTVAGRMYQITSADGGRRFFSVHAVPLRQQGVVTGAVTVLNDISERRVAERAVAETRDELAVTLSSIADGYYALDDQWCFTSLNEVAEGHFGRPAAELIGKNIWQVTESPVDSKIYRRFQRTRSTGRADHFEAASRIRPGYWAHLHLYPRDGLLEIYFTDISGRKQAEAALTRSEARFRKIFENAGMGIAITAWNGCFLQCNPAYCKLVGYSEAELRRIAFDAIIHPDDRMAYQEDIVRLKSGSVSSFEVKNRYIHRNGYPVWVSKFVSVLPSDTGQPKQILVLVSDISQQIAAREEVNGLNRSLVARTRLAERRSQEVRNLAMELTKAEERERQRIASVLHDDLQQILAYLKLRLNTAARQNCIEAELPFLNALIDKSIKRCRHLSHELQPFVMKRMDFLEVMKWLCRRMKEMYGLEVTLRVEGTPPIESTAAAMLLYRSIRELLFNIVKHAETLLATLELRFESAQTQVTVSDPGKGCDIALLRLRSADDTAFGLFTIEDRVKFLGGAMRIDSTPGKGFRATLWVPVSALDSRMAQTPSTFGPGGRESRVVDISAAALPDDAATTGIRVLVVDDHELMREGLTRLLQSETGITVVGIAADGQQAILMAADTRPDAVIMDISMPGLNGIDAAAQIKKTLPEVVIIGLTMHENLDIRQAMLDAGAEACLSKSEDLSTLVHTIKNLVDRRSS